MGMRFRKSIKLAPGIRMNLSASGLSLTAGPRGASVNFGKRGTYLNAGIPGTGIYAREPLNKESGHTSKPVVGKTNVVSIKVHIDDNGVVSILDENGNPAPESWVKAAKKQQGEVITNLIQSECDKINEKVASLGSLHQFTPNPKEKPHYIPLRFDTPRPIEPTLKIAGFFASLFKKRKERIELENVKSLNGYNMLVQGWEREKQIFDKTQLQHKKFIDQDIYTDAESMSNYLEGNLQDISWPKETLVSFEIFDNGKRIFLDVDLPELQDMPNKAASVPSRGMKLTIKEIGVTQVQKLYMQHVHCVGFRIIGEVFASLPVCEEVVLSAYSQRPNTSTGQIQDDYLYSVNVLRPEWETIRFDNLGAVDPVEALAHFNLKRDMTKTGVFKPIIPIEP